MSRWKRPSPEKRALYNERRRLRRQELKITGTVEWPSWMNDRPRAEDGGLAYSIAHSFEPLADHEKVQHPNRKMNRDD
jgi:hypothetical protein